jgi:putative transposase
MLCARMLAYITGTLDQELLLRNEYLAAENHILRAQVQGRLLLSDAEKATLAEIAYRLGRHFEPSNLWAMSIRCQASSVSGFAAAANPSKAFRKTRGRSPVEEESERLVVRMARGKYQVGR